MTHPALEARARGALKPLADDLEFAFPVKMPADLWLAIHRAARNAGVTPTDIIVDILRDAFPSEAPR